VVNQASLSLPTEVVQSAEERSIELDIPAAVLVALSADTSTTPPEIE
jgi:hypothetical protein